jgi:hypothetical protein
LGGVRFAGFSLENEHLLLMMDILMSETCWAHKKWNKIASDIKLVFHSSTILMIWKIPVSIEWQYSLLNGTVPFPYQCMYWWKKHTYTKTYIHTYISVFQNLHKMRI